MTTIEWTRGDDGSEGRVWNCLRGCSRTSPGCGGGTPGPFKGGCYAEKIAERFSGPGQAFEGFAERGKGWTRKVALIPEKLAEPLSWRKPCRVFVNSMSDLFHEGLAEDDIAEIFGVMAVASAPFHGPGDGFDKIGKPYPLYPGGKPVQMRSLRHLHGPHIFQILTKRAERLALLARPLFRKKVASAAHRWAMDRRCAGDLSDAIDFGAMWPLPNVHIGVSVESQKYADERIPLLLQAPAAVRWLSCEPQLGPIDLTRIRNAGEIFAPFSALQRWARPNGASATGIDWVVQGGESGRGARPFDLAWARSLRDQCATAKVAYFFKQAGARPFFADGLSQEFRSFEQWVNKGQSWLRGGSWQLVDARGRLCFTGADMMRARDEGAFPVVASPLLKLKSKKGGDIEELPKDLRVRQMPQVRP